MMIISLLTSSTWTRRFQVQREKSSQPKYLVLKVKTVQSAYLQPVAVCGARMPASTRSDEASCDPEENLAMMMTAAEFCDKGKKTC